MEMITFDIASCPETGGFIARWDDPKGGGITTQGDTIAELESMVRDAVIGYFGGESAMPRVRLHFIEDPELAVA
jgi:predicted RNase H-like HicB family nuclease